MFLSLLLSFTVLFTSIRLPLKPFAGLSEAIRNRGSSFSLTPICTELIALSLDRQFPMRERLAVHLESELISIKQDLSCHLGQRECGEAIPAQECEEEYGASECHIFLLPAGEKKQAAALCP
ncbi:hypothetical protein D3C72_1913160 [compost metagenome]